MQEHLNYSNPSEHNHVEVQYEIFGNKPRSFYEPLNHIVIKRWGVYAECICGPQKSGIPSLRLLSASHDEDYDDDDDLRVLPLPNIVLTLELMIWLQENISLLWSLMTHLIGA